MNESDHQPSLREGLASILGTDFESGNEITVLRNGQQIFPAMLEAIAGARESVDLLTFIYWKGEIAGRFAETLAKKAEEGVRVRVVLDAFGANEMSRRLVDQMRSGGVEVRWFRPFSFWHLKRSIRRTHRKVLVCDGRVGFTGGVGIASEWEGDARSSDEWRDTHVRVRGPAACGLRASFLANWLETGGSLEMSDLHRAAPSMPDGSDVQVVSKPGVWGWSKVMSAFMVSLKLARKRVRITTPYFVPGDIMVRELLTARQRGVAVEVLMPGLQTDERTVQHAGEARYFVHLPAKRRLDELVGLIRHECAQACHLLTNHFRILHPGVDRNPRGDRREHGEKEEKGDARRDDRHMVGAHSLQNFPTD